MIDYTSSIKCNRFIKVRPGSYHPKLTRMMYFFQAILVARVGRNVDGLDINLYNQSMKLLLQFQAEQANIQAS